MRVEFTADDSVVLTEGTRAVIRYDNLIGGRYLALEEGAGGLKTLNPGETIPLDRTAPALDLDALIGGFRPLFRALDPDQVNALTGQLIPALQGQGATIGSFLAQTAAVTNTLADRDQLIGQVIDNLNSVLGSLGDQSDQFDKAVDLAVGAGRRAGRAQDRHHQCGGLHQRGRRHDRRPVAAGAAAAARRSLHETRPRRRHRGGRPRLLRRPAQHTARRVPALDRQGMYGDYFSFYLCDMVLKLNGKGGQPVYVKVAGQSYGAVRAAMKSFAERNPLVIGLSASRCVAAIVLAALNYDKLPFFNQGNDVLRVLRRGRRPAHRRRRAGVGFPGRARCPASSSTGRRCWCTFNVDKNIRLGDRTEAAIKTKSLLGAKILEVTPRGDGTLVGPIPIERTTSPYQLPDALGDLASTISGLDTDQLSDSLATLAQTFADTPPD